MNQGGADGFSMEYAPTALHGDGTVGSTGGMNNENDYGGYQETGSGDAKACPACTYLNAVGSTFCEICQGRL
mgnify:CR=1 FL=1